MERTKDESHQDTEASSNKGRARAREEAQAKIAEEDDGHEAMALYEQGYRAGWADAIDEAAKVVENFKRDASFDDSQVGAGEHNANQANIAAAIRARKDTDAK